MFRRQSSIYSNTFTKIFEEVISLINDNALSEAAIILKRLHAADLADFLDNTSHKIHQKILPFLEDQIKPETLLYLSADNKQSVIEIFGNERSVKLIEQLDIEDAIEIIENLDTDIKSEILPNLDKHKQLQIIEGFAYPDDSVGRVLEKNFITLRQDWTIAQAIDHIRTYKFNNFHTAIVVNDKYNPIGYISLNVLLRHSKSKLVKKCMYTDMKVVNAWTKINELTFIFKQYALTIAPVVNKTNKLIGTVSINNMLYIIEYQTEKNIMNLSGIHVQDTFYNIIDTIKYRFPWLFVNLITTSITSMVINQFNHTISQLIILASIMPIVASIGGNAGMQATTVTVCALANKDINDINISKVIIKEILVCGLSGLLLSCIALILSYTMFHNFHLSIVFAISIVINFIIAGIFGSVIPITLQHLNIDPATASGVFLTAITDIFGFFIFLILSYIFLI